MRLRTSFSAAIAENRADRDFPALGSSPMSTRRRYRRGRLRCLRCASAERAGAISGQAGVVRANDDLMVGSRR